MSPTHADEMVGLLADGRLYAFLGDETPPSLEELRARYARQSAGRSPDGREVWHTWVVRERASGAAVGVVQATVADGTAELSWVIGVPWQGRGYATEAALAVRNAVSGPDSATGDDVARVHAHIAPGHTRSESVASRIGLVPSDHRVDGEVRWVREVSG